MYIICGPTSLELKNYKNLNFSLQGEKMGALKFQRERTIPFCGIT